MSVLVKNNTPSQVFSCILNVSISEPASAYLNINFKRKKTISSLIKQNFCYMFFPPQSNHLTEEKKKIGKRKQATLSSKISVFIKATFSKDPIRFSNDKNKCTLLL